MLGAHGRRRAGRERHINIHFAPEIMAGVYANFANVCHSDYEFTITFARVDHEVEDEEIPGVVVSRVNLSPRFMRELIDAMEDNYSKWRTREGIKNLPERPDDPPTLGRGRDRRTVAGRLERERDPLHRRRVAGRQPGPARRVGLADVLERRSGARRPRTPRRRPRGAARRGPRGTSTARDSCAALGPSRADTAPAASASAGRAAGPGSSARVAAATAAAAGTTAAASSPSVRRTSRWRTWASSWATTRRTSSGLKSRSSVSNRTTRRVAPRPLT